MDNLEKKLLARVTVNYLFLGQFETFRASLKNLRTASPDIAVGILHEIVQNLGHLEGISWSRSISSPSQLAWLALGELLELSESGLINQKDGLLWSLYQWLTHELEALFLLQQLIELLKIRPNLPLDYISEIKACSSETPQNDTPISRQEVQDEKSSNTSDGLLQADTARPSEADTILSEGISILNQIYDSWEAQLRSFISNAMANILQNKGPDFQGTEAFKTGSSMSDKQKEIFRQISVCEPQLFTALCWIIARQKERITTAPAGVSAKSDGNDEGQVEDQIMSGKGGFIDDGVFLKEVQDALLTVMKGKLDHVPVQDCVWHLRFLHTDFGDSESAYSIKDAGFEAQDILHRLNEESIRTCRLRIKGMTWTSCSTSIESSLSLLPGVKRAVVALATEEAQLDYNPNLVSYKQLMKAIEDTGFEAVLISVGEENDKLTLKVEGAHSIEGINLIKTSLEALPGVKSVEMELHVETVMVSYDPDQTGPRCFIEVIEATGFPLYNFKASVCNPPGIGGPDRSGEIAHYKVSFLWSCIFTIPVFLLSMVLMYVPGIKECLDTKIVNMLTIGQVLCWLLSTVVQVVFGRQFYVGSYKALRQAAANMDVLVALGTNAAYFYSVYIVLRSATSTNFVGADFFETNAMLISFILLGKYLEVLAKGKTSEAIAKLMELAPDIAVLLVTDVDGNIISERDVIQKIVRKAITPEFVALEDKNGTALLRTYQEVLASGNTTLLSMVETALDSCLKEAGDLFRSAHEPSVAPPLRYLHECLKCWRGEESMVQESSLSEIEVMHYCMRQLCHYSRVSGSHMFDLVMDAALSAIKMHQYQKTVDVLSLFPRLQPLAAVMGWDLLAGDTTARRKMMELLWKTKLVEFTAYKKHSEELQSCCIDYLCDQLCYHLEVAYFVARINSGLDWTPSYALFHIRGNKNGAKLIEEKPADGFVANLVLERLAMHSPIRVLFDVVPDLKLKHARALIKMFPISSVIAECKRLQDLELLELHYGIQAAVLALGAMERSMSTKENTKLTTVAIKLLEELHDHILSISNIPRRLFFMNIVVALLHMDDASGQPLPNGLDRKLSTLLADVPNSDDVRRVTAVAFIGHLLQILRSCLPSDGVEFEDQSPLSAFPKGFPSRAGLQAWMWRTSILQHFVDDWEWRLAVLQRLASSSQREWDWKEALAVLRAAPSTLLNMCVQRAQYDLGEEAVHRFALPPEDEAALQLAEWVDGAVARATVDEVVSRVAEGASSPAEALKLAGIRAPLAPLASVLLCVDVAAASARAIDMSKQLLHQARLLLAEISSGSRQVSNHAEQIQEACILSVSKRVLQCLQDLLDKVCAERDQTLQALLSGMDMVNASLESAKHGHKYRALNILQQTIEDAHNGKRQFLSGKLHNLVKALSDEDTEENSIRPLNSYTDRKHVSFPENGYLLGYGVRVPVKQPVTGMSAGPGDHSGEATFFPLKGTGKRFLGPLTAKPSAYLSAFILYVATIGDIVDGVDTTHDFNFFSLVYERCNDLLTRLVFERGSADAAGKIAEMMGADLVQEVISACVPPVFPPESSKGWARILLLPSQPAQFPDNHIDSAATDSTNDLITGLYPLKLDVVKHLSTLSPVRAILACVFGTGTFSKTTRTIDGISTLGTETDRSFYEFALDQSDRFPTLNRWIQMQANIQRLSDFPNPSRKGETGQENDAKRGELSKRKREIESEMESEEEEEKQSFFGLHPASHSWHETVERHSKEKHGHNANKSKASELERNGATSLVIDWENESIYEDAVQRLLEEGKMVDALALADRYIRGGAPDYLLQLLIENGNDSATQTTQWQGYPTQHSLSNISWQYCLRLRDKRLSAMLAIKHMKKWDLDAAIDVLTMCSCHLPVQDSLHGEVVRLKQSLQLYGRILRADSRFSNWQEVETLCQQDPEELALRLAGRGAVTAALEVAETYKLREELRRELQGRQVVKLLTLDPTNGGGPAEALRFLGSLKVPEDALPVAMAAMEQLPTLHSKQLLVHFFLKKQATRLSEDQLDHLHKLALGLHMLGALPIPWQQRCSALHQHPQLILETLLMWKQLQVASELLNAFPSLRDDNLILTYAAKAISVSIYPNYERRLAVQAGSSKPSNRITPSGRGNFGASMSNLQREARRAFSWTTKDSGNKIVPKETSRKRKSTALSPSQKAAWDAMTGVHEEKVHSYAQDSFERLTPVTMTEGWVLTGDPVKDNTVRSSHRYESAPCITLFKALLALCSSETVAVKACVRICIKQMKQFLNSEQLPSNASSETVERAFHATEAFVQALLHAKVQLKKLLGSQDSVALGEAARDSGYGSSETGGNEVTTKSLNVDSELSEDLSELLFQVVEWLSRAELVQSLLGSGVMVSLDDVLNENAAKNLCDRLINGEQYSMAVYCCTKCKLDAFPVWKSWAHALVQMEHYAQARVKLKQALRLHKGDAAPIIEDLILTMESSPPVDVSSVRSLYDHMAKNASTILDDSLSADAYLNVLYMPSSFTKSERSRRSSEDSVDSFAAFSAQANGEDGPRSNLDRSRYDECVYYLQEYARQDLLPFMFRHGHYADACLLFFPPKSVPLPPTMTNFSGQPPTSSPQRPDPLATDFGTIDDLCELCVAYGAIPVLERVIATRELGSGGQDPAITQHTAAALARVCSYCETHKLFNHLYRFQVLKKDHVAAGLCCIQLFLNSANQDQALRQLERAKMHFVEGISARQQVNEAQRSSTKASRTKSPSERFSEEELLRFSTRVSLQMDVVRCFSDSEGPPWKHSLFGNPNDTDTQKRRAEVAETLAERNNELAFQVISQFGLAAEHIYAAVAASLAERKKSNQLAELFKNIKATISDDDLDQVIAAAIMVFVNKHRERPDRLIEMLSSSHRKVLACVACGRLKAAFQIASRSQNLSDVQYVAHQARQTGSVTVEDMCKQWISRHNQGH